MKSTKGAARREPVRPASDNKPAPRQDRNPSMWKSGRDARSASLKRYWDDARERRAADDIYDLF